MKTFSEFLLEGKSPYPEEVEESIVRFHAQGIHNSIKTGENFSLDHVSDFVRENHPDHPHNVQILRRWIFNRSAHGRIVRRILQNDPSFFSVDLQVGAGKRQKEGIPGIGPKEEERIRRAKKSGATHGEISDRFGISKRNVVKIINK